MSNDSTEEPTETSAEPTPVATAVAVEPAPATVADADVATASLPPSPPPRKQVEVPALVDLNVLHRRPLAELHREAIKAELRVAGIRSKHQLIFELATFYGRHGSRIEAEGVLEHDGTNHGFLRWPEFSFAPLPDDLYVPNHLIRKYGLRPGNSIRCTARAARDKEKFSAVDEILSIEGVPVDQWTAPKPFDKLTALFPQDRIILENPKGASVSSRIVDLVAPLGKGQRGLIVAPPRGGKTLMLKEIARSIRANHPEIELIVLLLDERPEEVTDFREAVDVPVFSSTFDEPSRRHIQVSEMVAQRAKRLVELGKDVVILLDSLTRLARGHNQAQGGTPAAGRTMSGGLGSKALEKPRKFFGAARNVEEGGSLTILATALIETENRMDEVIFEEFKGTGNMEIALDREMVEKRIFPAIHLNRSGTRNDEKLYHPDEFRRVTILRRELAKLPAVEAMEVLIRNVKHTGSNAELLLKGLR
ncbi:MAG: transcription termination factor Rho [Verrucomicrobia bacterium]|jgi:transcription termination factor Rho|nr:MAG: transcription termination factor Rho [Verrucomicrobiota bacterium]